MKHEQMLEYYKEIVKYDSVVLKYNGRFFFFLVRVSGPNRRSEHKCYFTFLPVI
jgi:hypothetical protein